MKRIYGIILVASLFISLLAACGTRDNESAQYLYVSEKIFPEDIEMEPCAVWQEENYVYLLGFDMEAHEQIMVKGNLETKEITRTVLQIQMANRKLSQMNRAYVDANGSLHTLCYTFDEGSSYASGASLCVFDAQGRLVEEKGDQAALFSCMDLSTLLNFRVILPDDKMLFYSWDDGKSELIMLSADGERVFERDLGHDNVCDLRYCNNQVIILERIDADKYRISEVDLDTGEKRALLNEFISDGFPQLTYGTDVDIIGIKSAEGIWRLDAQEGIKKLVAFEDANLNPMMVRHTGMLEDGSMVVFTEAGQQTQNDHSHGNRDWNFYLLRKEDGCADDEIAKAEIIYAVFGPKEIYAGDVYAYNSSSKDVKITLKTYENTDLFIQDVIAGNVPDLVDIMNGEEVYHALEAKGLLEDLNPYLLQDKEIAKKDFLDNTLRFYEKDGHVYAIPYGLMVSVIMCDENYLGKREGWNFSEFNDFIKSLPDPQMGTKAIYNQDILWNLCYHYMNHFVNVAEGKCAFCVEEFYDILECASLFPSSNAGLESVDSLDSLLRDIQDGEIVMIPMQIGNVENYGFWRSQFPRGVKIIGLPSEEENGISLIPTGWTIGMLKTCERKDEAWDFIKHYLTSESPYVHVSAFPSYRPFFDDMMEKARQEASKGEDTNDVPTVTYEEVDLLQKLVTTGKPITDSDDKILQIILEEADAYFSGSKTTEQTAETIQNRVQLYLSE